MTLVLPPQRIIEVPVGRRRCLAGETGEPAGEFHWCSTSPRRSAGGQAGGQGRQESLGPAVV